MVCASDGIRIAVVAEEKVRGGDEFGDATLMQGHGCSRRAALHEPVHHLSTPGTVLGGHNAWFTLFFEVRTDID